MHDPVDAKTVPELSKSRGEERFLYRHEHFTTIRKCRKDAFRLGVALDTAISSGLPLVRETDYASPENDCRAVCDGSNGCGALPCAYAFSPVRYNRMQRYCGLNGAR
jgi:hypothetical protein